MDWLFSCKFVTLTDRVDRVIGVKATFSEANLDSESLWLSESESGSSTAKEKEKKPLILTNLNQFLQCPPLLTLQITNIKFIYLFTSLIVTYSMPLLEVGEGDGGRENPPFWSCHFCFQPMKYLPYIKLGFELFNVIKIDQWDTHRPMRYNSEFVYLESGEGWEVVWGRRICLSLAVDYKMTRSCVLTVFCLISV